jgi:hypothetical protein
MTPDSTADSTDPASSLSRKMAEFASSLPDAELEMFHDIVHLAGTSPEAEVEGFAVKRGDLGADPCEGGEIFNPVGTFQVLGNLHQTLHPMKSKGGPHVRP